MKRTSFSLLLLCVYAVCASAADGQSFTFNKTDGGLSTQAGALLTYAITIENAGTTTESVRITETVPLHTSFRAQFSSPGWSCPDGAPAGTKCEIDLIDVEP
ncbi:MAG TPA: hypothetical protein VGG06_19025, partial [Thermoanaerobaculia bacterium]